MVLPMSCHQEKNTINKWLSLINTGKYIVPPLTLDTNAYLTQAFILVSHSLVHESCPHDKKLVGLCHCKSSIPAPFFNVCPISSTSTKADPSSQPNFAKSITLKLGIPINPAVPTTMRFPSYGLAANDQIRSPRFKVADKLGKVEALS